MKKIISYILAFLFAGAFLFGGFLNQNQAQAETTPIPNPAIEGFVSNLGYPGNIVLSADGTKAYMATNPFGLTVLDISNPTTPQIYSNQFPHATDAYWLAVSEEKKIAIVTKATKGIDVVDISSLESPKVITSFSENGYNVGISGNYAYVYGGFEGELGQYKYKFYIMDISISQAPRIVKELNLQVASLLIDGTTMFTTTSIPAQVVVYSLNDPLNPQSIGTLSLSNLPIGHLSKVSNNLLALSLFGTNGFKLIDVSNLNSPQIIGSADLSAYKIVAQGNFVYTVGGSYFKIVNISNPQSPQIVSSSSIEGTGLVVKDSFAYILGETALTVLNISNPSSPQQVTTITNKLTGSKVDISEQKGIAVIGKETNGIDVVDISSLSWPKVVASFEGYGYKVEISGNYAYVSGGNKLKIIDIANPATPKMAKIIDLSINTFDIDGDKMFALSFYSNLTKLIIYNLADPLNPQLISTLDVGNSSPKAIKKIRSNLLALSVNTATSGLKLVDITNLSLPQIIGSANIPANDIAVQGNYLYTITSKFQVVDITSPSNPQILGSVSFAGAEHLAISNNYAYVTSQGNIRIINFSNPTSPQLIQSYPSMKGGCQNSDPTRCEIKQIIFSQNKLYIASELAGLEIYRAFGDKVNFKLTADKSEVSSGDEVTYTLTLTNPSPNTLTNFNMSDAVPIGTTYINSSASGNATYISATRTLTWPTYPSMASNQTITETFKVKVN